MQIKIITCHDVYNHGASLQAYALQTYIGLLGHSVEIIDYKPDYLCGDYQLWSVNNPAFDKLLFKPFYLLAKLPQRLYSLKRKWAFDHYTKQYLKLTAQCFHSNEELKLNPPLADIYIAGSDQIWNTLFQNGRDAAFYLRNGFRMQPVLQQKMLQMNIDRLYVRCCRTLMLFPFVSGVPCLYWSHWDGLMESQCVTQYSC